MESFKHVAHVADIDIEGKRRPVILFIKWDGKRFSVSSVEGPKRNGDAWGSCGQSMPSSDWIGRAGVDLRKLGELWGTWHLNDMRPGCEHQRDAGWGSETLEVTTYKLTKEARKTREEAGRKAALADVRGEVAELDETERALLAVRAWYADVPEPPDADSPLSGCYEVSKREQKRSGWVYPEEHPSGVLGKPCPECGYRYGTRWLHEEVPEDVLAYFAALPGGRGVCPTLWLRD